ncbi:DNA-binding protein [Lentzea sp. NBRC 105346]|uniref:YbaB/EbfC family nucleoid-associated protein n=1 Tax=Lentzea sp. NBRC 105346 TaxID=3032205 RepID=UPI0024A50E75|nr:YbaB/EbfC family nucleoid-associated protein [Lentzea sp. NBRC 105346]GLZ32415.1 DNA-binding protein [Lentzea sp. NBRC 105346]
MSEPRWDSLLSGDPSQVERGIDDWVEGVRQRADRMQQVRDQVDRIQITETSGAVSVTVDANGVPTDIRFDDAASRVRPSELGPLVMGCLRRAQSRISERVREATAAAVGDDLPETRRMLVDNYRRRFGEAEPEAPRPKPRTDDDIPDESFFE